MTKKILALIVVCSFISACSSKKNAEQEFVKPSENPLSVVNSDKTTTNSAPDIIFHTVDNTDMTGAQTFSDDEKIAFQVECPYDSCSRSSSSLDEFSKSVFNGLTAPEITNAKVYVSHGWSERFITPVGSSRQVIDTQNSGDENNPFEISQYQANTEINGLYANVATELTIINHSSTNNEGTLDFPLPDGAVVIGYAIEVNGEMAKVLTVDKKTAAQDYANNLVMKFVNAIEPSLIEQTDKNVYRIPISPTSAQGAQHIRVEYTMPLAKAPNGDALLVLPMPTHKLAKRDISITARNTTFPILTGLGKGQFTAADQVYRAEIHETDTVPQENVLVTIPAMPKVVTGIENNQGEYFFTADIDLPQTNDNAALPELPLNWRILWDASGSRTEDDVAQSLEMINLLPENGQYELYVFRNITEPAQNFSNRAALLSALKKLDYDGGTNLYPLAWVSSQKFDGKTLIFTDSVDTMNNTLEELAENTTIVLSGKTVNRFLANDISHKNIIDLNQTTASDAISALRRTSRYAISFNGEGISNVVGLGEFTSTNHISIAGRMEKPVDKALMTLSDGTKYQIEFAQATEGNTLSSHWAAKRVSMLAPCAEIYRDELVELGSRFNIVSPVTSLVKLSLPYMWLEPSENSFLHIFWDDRQNNWHIQDKLIEVDSYIQEIEDAKAKGESDNGHNEWIKEWQNLQNKEWKDWIIEWSSLSQMHTWKDINYKFLLTDKEKIQEEPEVILKNPKEEQKESRLLVGKESIERWTPEMPYLKAMMSAPNKDEYYSEYLKQRPKYANSPAFYFDVAAFFFAQNDREHGLRILSNLSELGYFSYLLELKTGDPTMLRVYAYRLRDAGALDEAIAVLRKVAHIDPENIHSWRDLALTLTLKAKKYHSAKDAQEALELYVKATETPMIPNIQDSAQISVIAFDEFNELASWCERQKWPDGAPKLPEIDKKFRQNHDADLRFVISREIDQKRIYVHLIEPTWEDIKSESNLNIHIGNNNYNASSSALFISSNSEGPEVMMKPHAPKGTYEISAKYFAPVQQELFGPETVTVTVFKNWGRENQESQTFSARLDKPGAQVTVGTFEVK